MHARSKNLHDCARSAPEICAIFEKRTLSFSYFQKPKFLAMLTITANRPVGSTGPVASQHGLGGVMMMTQRAR